MSAPSPRYHHLDALRGIAMLLGVVLHATLSLGEPAVLRWSSWDVSSGIAFSWIAVGIHAFRMQLFFILAGFFARMLYLRLGERDFVRHRLRRVGLPLLVSAVVLIPITMATHIFGVQSMDEATLTGKFLQYGGGWEHIWDFYKASTSDLLSPRFMLERYRLFHLWFLEYLLVMYVVWVGGLRFERVARAAERVGSWMERGLRAWWGQALLGALLVPLLLTMPEGVPTPKHPPHPPTWLYYTAFFAVGWVMHRAPELLELTTRRWPVQLGLAAALMPVVMMLRVAVVGDVEGDLVIAPLDARIPFVLAYAALTITSTFGILGAFDRTFRAERPALRYLADSAYWIYLVHLPIVKVMQAFIADAPVNGWVKLVGVTVLASGLCLLSYEGLVRYTAIGRVLHGPRTRPGTEVIHDPDRGLLWSVPVVASTLIAFEVLTHRQLVFVADGLSALTAIPIAVMGLGLGGLLAHRNLEEDRSARHGWLYVASVGAVLILMPFLGDWLPRVAPILMAPYIFGGALLSRAFARLPTATVYPLDLVAAAAGVVVVALGLPLFHEEGMHLVVFTSALLVPAVVSVDAAVRRMATSLALTMVVVVGVQVTWRPYNLAEISGQTLPPRSYARGVAPGSRFDKIFTALRADGALSHERTASSVAGRVDIVRQFTSPEESFLRVYENGNSIDVMFTRPVDKHHWDPRLPTPLFADSPRVFIIGTAGEGILKSSRYLGGPVRGTEIDTALLSLAKGPLAADCGDCYDDIDVIADEGRATLSRMPDTYDVITLLNTHISKGVVQHRAADAEFIHTVEANRLMFERLTPEGVILWEHPRVSGANGRVAMKQISTAWEALADMGITQPWRHTVAWRWGGYDQVAIARSAITVAELEAFETWLTIDKKQFDGTPPPTQLIWAPHHPGQGEGPLGEWLALVGTDGRMPMNAHPSRLIITDNRPFPFDMPDARSSLFYALGLVGMLGLLCSALLTLVTARAAAGTAWVRPLATAALSGFAYLFVEAALLHHLPRLVGSPTEVVTLVLVTMLTASGAGGAIAGRLPPMVLRALLVALPLSVAAMGLFLNHADNVLAMDFGSRVGVSIGLVMVPAILMGLPLPLAVERGRAGAGDSMGALLFALNGAAGAVGVLAAMMAAVTLGFSGAWWTGAALYAMVAVLAWR